MQDCGCGGGVQKCVPWSGDGDDTPESVKCVPVARDPAPVGAACKVEGSIASGIDDCDLETICWHVDPDSLMGTCVAQCKGTPDAPDCSNAPGTVCMIAYDGVITLCLPLCDPLAQDCLDGEMCVPNPSDDAAFQCMPDASGDEGQAFDPCQSVSPCDKGLACVDPALAAECDANAPGCCLPYCDLSMMPPVCPGADHECVPWYAMGEAPAGYEDVGVCGLPP